MSSAPRGPRYVPSFIAALALVTAFLLPVGAPLVPQLAVGPAPLLAQEAAEEAEHDRWTPALSMLYRQVSGTAISPDGSRIAYVVREPLMDGEQSEYRSHIWVVTADGADNLQYTRGEKSTGQPQFSPDGRHLAFTTARSGENQIWVIPMGGGEAHQVTEAENGVGAFRWSPDGMSIAFTMRDPDSEEEKAAKNEKRDVILVDQNFKYQHLYVVEVAAPDEEPNEAERVTEGAFHVTGFDWTPDGQHLVFAHQPDPRINTARLSGDISVVPAAGGSLRQLVGGAGVETSPSVSPDGRWVAYRSTGAQPEPIGLGDLSVVALEGGTPKRLADTPDRSPGLLGWSRDGESVYVTESPCASAEPGQIPRMWALEPLEYITDFNPAPRDSDSD